MRSGYVTLLVTAVLLFLLEVGGWNLFAYSRLSTALERADPVAQVGFNLAHPLEFAAILAKDVWTRGFSYLLDWIAIYGFAYWPVPVWTYLLYAAGLLSALFLKEKEAEIGNRTRIALGIVFLLTYLGTLASMYVTFTPVGSAVIDGVQGRYFVTVMPLLFLALACIPAFKRIQLPGFLPASLAVTSLLLYTAGMYLSYHVPCGSQFYRAGLCYQPNYKNWAPDDAYSPPVSDRLTLRQEIIAECDGMTELRVWIDASGTDLNGTTEFTLADMNEGYDVINVSVPNSDFPSGDWYTLTFQPDWGSNGKFYLLTIQGGANGPRIAYSLRPEYPAGKLFENDQALGQDLIFQTGCIAGWEKMRETGSP